MTLTKEARATILNLANAISAPSLARIREECRTGARSIARRLDIPRDTQLHILESLVKIATETHHLDAKRRASTLAQDIFDWLDSIDHDERWGLPTTEAEAV